MGIKRGTARSVGACRQAFLTVLRADPCGRITRGKSCDSPGVGSNLPCRSPPFSPKLAWGKDRGAFPCAGASRAGPGATHPALLAWHPEAPVLPELGGAGRAHVTGAGSTRTSPAAGLVEAGQEALPCTLRPAGPRALCRDALPPLSQGCSPRKQSVSAGRMGAVGRGAQNRGLRLREGPR